MISKQEILTSVVIFLISSNISKLSQSISHDILIPIIDVQDKNNHKKLIKDFTINLNGHIFQVGKFFINLIDFFIVLIIVFLIRKKFLE